jgi:RHS repeat-associated protein
MAGRLVARSLPYTQPGGTASGTAFAHDALARVREVRDALGGVLRIDFGPGASPSAVRAANGVETRYEYDAWDRLVARASPDSGGIAYAYDPAGNRVRASSASGAAIGYAYDALDRLVLIDYATGVDTRYVYDEAAGEHGVGRLTRRIDESGTTAYVYDARGNVGEKILVSDGRQWTTVYRHDAADRLIEIVYPSGRRVRYERDPDGSVARVATAGAGAAEQDVLTAIEHAPFGPPRAWRHGNGVDMRRTYDLDYRLSALEYTGILRRHYAYDAAGNIARVDDPAQPAAAERYRYDALDRLVAADGPWGGLAYAYDANGNRLRASHDTWDARYRYQAGSNRLQSIDARPFAPLRSLLYDSAGRVMRDSAGLRYAYGRNERLATVTQGALARTTRLIHAAGGGIAQERLEVREAGGTRSVTRRFHYDEAGRLLAIEESEDAAASPRLSEFIYLEDTLIAWQHGGALEHVHGDHLGVPLALSAGDGTVLASAAPVPFNGTGAAGPLAAIGYPGQWAMLGVDALMHNGAREYAPGLGRYLSPDPLDLAGGLNGYAYAENNPVALSDPTGTCPWCAAYVAGVAGRALAGAALGAAFNLAEQLYSSTGRWDCVAWAEVGRSAAAGALVAGGIGAYAGRPFWQYFPAGNPAYASRWMTRGAGFKPPYAPGADARGPLSLPPWNPGTAVRGVVPSWWQAVRGPRAVRPGFGQPGGGAEYYRGLGW